MWDSQIVKEMMYISDVWDTFSSKKGLIIFFKGFNTSITNL